METDDVPASTPKLPLFSSMAPMPQSPEHSGMLTPPLYTSASVPFRWEEEPGKPRPCTALIPFPTASTDESPKCLDLPPRLLFNDPIKTPRTLSPTTVLEGPDVVGRPKFTSSSFRFFRERRQGSFDSNSSSKTSPERGQLSSVVLGKKLLHKKGRGGQLLLGSWRKNIIPKLKPGKYSPSSVSVDAADFGNRESSSISRGGIRRNGSFSTLSHARSHFWAAVYEGFKQAMPWKSKKSKKGLV